jgi:GNAT superfamily N-acetyltransferase
MLEFCRFAAIDDAAEIACLLPHLGYRASTEEVRERLHGVLSRNEHAVILAVADHALLGLCHVAGVRNLAANGYAEVLELVVRKESQGRGIGKRLLRRAEAQAAAWGYQRVRLGSGAHRTEAHAFYEHVGYTKSRAGHTFELHLPAMA